MGSTVDVSGCTAARIAQVEAFIAPLRPAVFIVGKYMAGTIEVRRDVRWSASSWLFDWVVRTLADAVRPSNTAAVLDEVVYENLGWLGLDDVSMPGRLLLRDVICRTLLDSAEKELPIDLAGRDDVLSGLRELVELSCGHS